MRTDDEICPADILGMSAIQCLAPNLSIWLWENSDYLFGEKVVNWTSDQLAQFNQDFESTVRRSCKDCLMEPSSISRHILGLDLTEKHSRRYEIIEETARIKGRVSSYALFKLFYCSKLESGSSKTEFDLICNTSNSKSLSDAFSNLRSDEEKTSWQAD